MHNFTKDRYTVINKKLTINQINEILKLAIDEDLCIATSLQKNKRLNQKDYPYLGWDGWNITRFQNHTGDIGVSIEEFILFMKGKGKQPYQETLKLNDEYTAEITKEGVKVGCNYFSHKLIENLYKLSLKVQKSKN